MRDDVYIYVVMKNDFPEIAYTTKDEAVKKCREEAAKIRAADMFPDHWHWHKIKLERP